MSLIAIILIVGTILLVRSSIKREKFYIEFIQYLRDRIPDTKIMPSEEFNYLKEIGVKFHEKIIVVTAIALFFIAALNKNSVEYYISPESNTISLTEFDYWGLIKDEYELKYFEETYIDVEGWKIREIYRSGKFSDWDYYQSYLDYKYWESTYRDEY